MTFIRLTNNWGREVFLSPAHIVKMQHCLDDKCSLTHIVSIGNTESHVRETPEEIIDLINGRTLEAVA